MKLDIYLNYRSTCEQALKFYEQHTPPDWKAHFANRFAMFRDKFGTSWMLLHQLA